MPDPTLPRKPPPLRLTRAPAVTEAERRQFEAAVADTPFHPSPGVLAALAAREGARRPVTSPHALLRDLQAGRRRVADDCEISLRQRTQAEARDLLEGFLRARRVAGARFVRVIHGKGYGSPGGRAVLAQRVPEWLAAWKPELVTAWGEARREDGGSGALYVVLAGSER